MADKATRINPGPIEGSRFLADGAVVLGPDGSSLAALIAVARSALMPSGRRPVEVAIVYIRGGHDSRPEADEDVAATAAKTEAEAADTIADTNAESLWALGFATGKSDIVTHGLTVAGQMLDAVGDAPEVFLGGYQAAIDMALASGAENGDAGTGDAGTDDTTKGGAA